MKSVNLKLIIVMIISIVLSVFHASWKNPGNFEIINDVAGCGGYTYVIEKHHNILKNTSFSILKLDKNGKCISKVSESGSDKMSSANYKSFICDSVQKEVYVRVRHEFYEDSNRYADIICRFDSESQKLCEVWDISGFELKQSFKIANGILYAVKEDETHNKLNIVSVLQDGSGEKILKQFPLPDNYEQFSFIITDSLDTVAYSQLYKSICILDEEGSVPVYPSISSGSNVSRFMNICSYGDNIVFYNPDTSSQININISDLKYKTENVPDTITADSSHCSFYSFEKQNSDIEINKNYIRNVSFDENGNLYAYAEGETGLILSQTDEKLFCFDNFSYRYLLYIKDFAKAFIILSALEIIVYLISRIICKNFRGNSVVSRIAALSFSLMFAGGTIIFFMIDASVNENIEEVACKTAASTGLSIERMFFNADYTLAYTPDSDDISNTPEFAENIEEIFRSVIDSENADFKINMYVLNSENELLSVNADDYINIPAKYFHNDDTLHLYMDTLNRSLQTNANTFVMTPQTDKDGEWYTLIYPVLSYNEDFQYEKFGILEMKFNKNSLHNLVCGNRNSIFMIAVICLGIFVTAAMIVLCIMMNPLKSLNVQIKNGKVDVPERKIMESEISRIHETFAIVTGSIGKKQDEMLKNNMCYYRFIPSGLINLLDAQNIAELQTGKCKNIIGSLVNISFSPEKCSAEDILKIISRYDVIVVSFTNQNMLLMIAGNKSMQITDIISSFSNLQNGQVIIAAGYGDMLPCVIGSEKRRQITVISEQVTLNERISRIALQYKLSAVITKSLKSTLNDNLKCRFIGIIPSKESDVPIELYDVYEYEKSSISEIKDITKHLFESAVNKYIDGKIRESAALFAEVLRQDKNDFMAKKYLECCDRFAEDVIQKSIFIREEL